MRMKTKLLKPILGSMLAVSLMLSPLPAFGASNAAVAAAASSNSVNSSIKVYVDGYQLTLAQSPFKVDGVTLVPMRDIFDALNATVNWEGSSQTITGGKDGTKITLKVGSKDADINGSKVQLDSPAIIRNSTTFVPVRFVAEALDAEVKWNNATQSVHITSAEAKGIDYANLVYETLNKPKLTTTEIVDAYDMAIVLIGTNRGQGSGVVIGDNLILTNHHVITEASTATAYTLSGEQLSISGVVVYDEKADLAILKTDKKIGIKPVEVGIGLNARKGDSVIAIGSPLGVQNTVSDGVISNITYEDGIRYIQTSTPIDHGSSGGALFNQYGQLIGITTLGITGSNADINFAVSIIHASMLVDTITKEKLDKAAFLPSRFPESLTQASLEDMRLLMRNEFGSVQTSDGTAAFTNWKVVRDNEGWLVFTADIDPIFYMYYGASSASELRFWMINMGHELHRMLPNDRIQVLISFERDYGFKPRGLEAHEVTSIGGGQWRVRYPVIDMQLKDQLYIEYRI